MKEINVDDNIVIIKKNMYEDINNLTQGRKVEDLSTEKLIELKNTLKEYNLLLEQKYQKQAEELDELKAKIKDNIKKLKYE